MAQNVKSIMTSHPKTCLPEHTAKCALEIMSSMSVGAVPIVDQNEKVVGIVTDRDIALCLLQNANKTVNDLNLNQCGNFSHMITIQENDSIDHALSLMEKNQIRRIPVVNNQGKCVGIVAQADIALHVNLQQTGEFVRDVSEHRQSIGAH